MLYDRALSHLVTRPKYPPHRKTGCSNTPVALCFPVVSQTIAATPTLLSLTVAYRIPKTGLTRGASQKKLASAAYRAIGGVARNSNRQSRYSGTLSFPRVRGFPNFENGFCGLNISEKEGRFLTLPAFPKLM